MEFFRKKGVIIGVIAGVAVIMGAFFGWQYIRQLKIDVKKDLVIRIRPHQQPNSYNPLTQFKTETLKLSEVGLAVSECVFDGLFNRTIKNVLDEQDDYCRKTGKPCYEYGLAKYPLQSEYGDIASKTWYIDIRQDWYWHGTQKPVTATDVIHTYKCIEKGGSESPWRERLRRYIEQEPFCWRDNCVKYPSKVVFVFNERLKEEEVMQLLTFKIIPEKFKANDKEIDLNPKYMREDKNRKQTEYDENWKMFNRNPTGTGPYKIKITEPDQIVLERDHTNDEAKRLPKNVGSKGLPRYVCFKVVNDDRLLPAMDNKKINFTLYAPSQYKSELIKNRNNYEYAPFYFYALVFGKEDEISKIQIKKICCVINEQKKSEILDTMGIPKPKISRYINQGPFPWNWNLFSGKDQFTDKTDCNFDYKSSQKQKIELIYNEQDVRTRALAVLISGSLKNHFNVRIKSLDEMELMRTIRSQNYQMAIIIWEGFDQDYSISELYTPEPKNNLNITNLSKNVRDSLSTHFMKFMRTRDESRRFAEGQEIHDIINKAKPYHYLFTLPRTAIYTNAIKNVDKYPVHPETFLPNIRKWRME